MNPQDAESNPADMIATGEGSARIPEAAMEATADRAFHVRTLMNESLRNRTPQDRDRLMQVHLAQARGAKMNACLLKRAMDFRLRILVMRRMESGDAR